MGQRHPFLPLDLQLSFNPSLSLSLSLSLYIYIYIYMYIPIILYTYHYYCCRYIATTVILLSYRIMSSYIHKYVTQFSFSSKSTNMFFHNRAISCSRSKSTCKENYIIIMYCIFNPMISNCICFIIMSHWITLYVSHSQLHISCIKIKNSMAILNT